MVRVTNGLQRQRRHKGFRDLAKGFTAGRRTVYKQVRLALVKQGQHAYVGRKLKKRDFRKLWIERLSGALQAKGLSYGKFMHAITEKDIALNRKVLSTLAVRFPVVFDGIVEKVK